MRCTINAYDTQGVLSGSLSVSSFSCLDSEQGLFGIPKALLSQVFAPTELRVTFESAGPGAFTAEQVAEMVVKDASGVVTELRLPNRMVIIANHQVRSSGLRRGCDDSYRLQQNSVDWLYIWSLTYFMNMHRDVLIVLKKSLKWVPIAGRVRALLSSPVPA